MQEQNPPNSRISDKKKEIPLTSEQFKRWFVMLPIMDAFPIRDQIKEKCGWSTQVWYNKINGVTRLSISEMTIIAQVAGKDKDQMFNP